MDSGGLKPGRLEADKMWQPREDTRDLTKLSGRPKVNLCFTRPSTLQKLNIVT